MTVGTAYCGAHAGRAGELLVVVLLEAVLATTISVDESKDMAGERGSHTAARLRIEANTNLFEGHAADAIRRDLSSNDVGLSVIKRWKEHPPLAAGFEHGANLGRGRGAQRKRRDQRVSRGSPVRRRDDRSLGEEAMAQHRCRKHDGTRSVGNGSSNGLVRDGGAQLGGGRLKQLIASNNLPVAEARDAHSGNKDQNKGDDIGAEARVGAYGAWVWRHLANLHDKWVHKLHNAEASHATSYRRLPTESAHVCLANTNLFHEAGLLIDERSDLRC